MKAAAAREQRQRKINLQKYVPNACNAIWTVLEDMVAGSGPHGSKRRRLESSTDLMERVREKRIGSSTLQAKLNEHIDKIDMDMALEYQVTIGRGGQKADLQMAPMQEDQAWGDEIHTDCAVIRLMKEF